MFRGKDRIGRSFEALSEAEIIWNSKTALLGPDEGYSSWRESEEYREWNDRVVRALGE